MKSLTLSLALVGILTTTVLSGCISVKRDAPPKTTTTTTTASSPLSPSSTTVQRTTTY